MAVVATTWMIGVSSSRNGGRRVSSGGRSSSSSLRSAGNPFGAALIASRRPGQKAFSSTARFAVEPRVGASCFAAGRRSGPPGRRAGELVEPGQRRPRLAEEGRQDDEQRLRSCVALRGGREHGLGVADQAGELALALGERPEDLAAAADQPAVPPATGCRGSAGRRSACSANGRGRDRDREVLAAAAEAPPPRPASIAWNAARVCVVEGAEDLVELDRLRDLRRRQRRRPRAASAPSSLPGVSST